MVPEKPGTLSKAGTEGFGPGSVPDLGVGRRTRKVFTWILAAAVSGLFGVALLFFPPLLLVGAVLGLTAVVLVLRQPFLGLLLYAVVYMVRPGELYPVLSVLRLERVVAVGTLAAMFFEMHRKEGGLFLDGTRQTMWLFAFLGAVFLSIPTSFWVSWSVTITIELLKIIAFYLMIVHLVNTRKRIRIFVWTYLLLILYLAGSSLKAYYTGGFEVAQGIDRAVGLTSAGGDPNALANTLGSTLGMYFLLVGSETSLGRRLLAALGSGILLWTLMLTGSRGGVLAVLAVLVFLWWRSRHRVLGAVVGLLFIASVFSILPDQYKARYSSMTHSELDASSQGRITAWKKGVRMFVDHPLFGVGIGNFGNANAIAYSSGRHRSYLKAHNLYVQVFAETGLVGAVAFFGFMFQFLRLNRRAARRTRSRGDAWKFETAVLDGLMAGFVCLLVAGMFGHSLLRSTWYIFAAMGLAIHRVEVDATETPLELSLVRGARSGSTPVRV